MARRILIIEDEASTRANLEAYLLKEGFETYTASDGVAGLSAFRSLRPDLVVLDIMLPGMDGIEVLRRLRQISDVYVLMLTARADETDKVVGLSMGADDYLAKPFSPRELTARIQAILRRGRGESVEVPLVFEKLRMDPAARRVWKNDVLLDLTPIEFDLLYAMARHAGRVLSREQLIEHVWGHDYYGDERVVDVHIGRLRKKIEMDPAQPELVVTVRSAGYRFEDGPA